MGTLALHFLKEDGIEFCKKFTLYSICTSYVVFRFYSSPGLGSEPEGYNPTWGLGRRRPTEGTTKEVVLFPRCPTCPEALHSQGRAIDLLKARRIDERHPVHQIVHELAQEWEEYMQFLFNH